jgi:hypothetical protein
MSEASTTEAGQARSDLDDALTKRPRPGRRAPGRLNEGKSQF